MKKINCHISHTDLLHASRLRKETETLIKSGLADEVVVFGKRTEGLPEFERVDSKRIFIRFKLLKSKLFPRALSLFLGYIIWGAGIVRWRFDGKLVLINCHSLSVLPIGIVLKLWKGASLVYDTHELETEQNGTPVGGNKVLKILEKFMLRFVDETIVVSESIADWYKSSYGLGKRPYVVRNLPPLAWAVQNPRDAVNLREKFSIPIDAIIYIYHGGVTIDRSIPLMLDVFSELSWNQHLIIMGYGPLVEMVREASERKNNIHYLAPVESGRVVGYISGADCAICLIENSCLSYYFSLPNKLFESIMAKIPIVVSDFPEMAKIVDSYGVGWKIQVSRESLRNFILSLSRQDIDSKSARLEEASRSLNWENESARLDSVYFRAVDHDRNKQILK